MPEVADIAVIGAGAAGLMAAIWAGRTCRASGGRPSIIAIDGASRLGAKILVAGGGRCNVTHHAVDESAYAGSSRNAIKKVLRRFDVAQTVEFFKAQGVELKREETGKLFPTTDNAHTILDAVLAAAAQAGVELVYPWRVETILRDADAFVILNKPDEQETGQPMVIRARRIILATGGRSLPKTGSDGHGYDIARSLGHSITPRVFPALVPLTLPKDHFICGMSGLTVPAAIELRSGTGKRLVSFTNSTLCTHFGLSGPGVLDISRYYSDAAADAREKKLAPPVLLLNWLPGTTAESLDQELQALARAGSATGAARFLMTKLPERLARVLCEAAGVDAAAPLHQLTREKRRALVQAATELPLPVTGDRGYTYAEVTAGGVPLSEVHLETMESRACPGLSLCGEICDVDGRIGGFNFQWAWASGFVAGTAAGS